MRALIAAPIIATATPAFAADLPVFKPDAATIPQQRCQTWRLLPFEADPCDPRVTAGTNSRSVSHAEAKGTMSAPSTPSAPTGPSTPTGPSSPSDPGCGPGQSKGQHGGHGKGGHGHGGGKK